MLKPWLIGVICAAAIPWIGCGAESDPSPASGGPAGGQQEPADSGCPYDNLTRKCECTDHTEQVPGRQTCSAETGWSRCECASLPSTIDIGGNVSAPSLNQKPERFDWFRTVPTGGSCEPGRYNGAFDGSYLTGVAPFPVMGNLSFDLGTSTNGEFFEVSGGKMAGSALVIFPFQAEIVGTLDCSNSYFDGYMRNGFYVDTGGQKPFEGPLRAQYDKFNHAFINGVWSVTEPDNSGNFPPPPEVRPNLPLPAPPPKGGVGTWSTTWVP